MANARMANSDHDSDLYMSFSLIDAPDAAHDPTSPPAIRTIDLDSSEPFELPEDTPYAAATFKSGEASGAIPSGLAPGQLWLNGSVLMCACPDCRAPMSIRFWLMIADCWQCGTSIELSEEQEREAKRLLAAHEKSAMATRPSSAAATRPLPDAKSEPAAKKLSTPQPNQQPKPSKNGNAVTKPPQQAAASPTRPAAQPQQRRDPPQPPGHAPGRPRPTRRPPPRRPVSALENRVRARLQRSAALQE